MIYAHGGVELVICEDRIPSHRTLEGKAGIVGKCRELLWKQVLPRIAQPSCSGDVDPTHTPARTSPSRHRGKGTQTPVTDEAKLDEHPTPFAKLWQGRTPR